VPHNVPGGSDVVISHTRPDGTVIPSLDLCSVLFCYLAVLDPRIGHTMDVLFPFISVLCHFD